MNDMRIQKPVWTIPALWLHSWIVLAAFWPIPAAVIGFQKTDCLKYLLISLVLFLPVVASYYLIRVIRKLWQYVFASAFVLALTGFIAELCVRALRICPEESLLLPSVSRMFEEGVPQLAAKLLAVGSSLFLGFICLCIRGSVRIKKMKLKKAFEEMEGGSAPILDKADWEFPTILDAPHVYQWIYYGICYLICALLNVELCYRMLFWLLLMDVVLLLVCNFEERLYVYIRDHRRIANLPAVTMRRIGRIVMRMALLVLLVCMLPAILYGREPAAGILDKLPEPEPVEMSLPQAPENTVTSEQEPDEMLEYLKSIEPVELPRWLKKLLAILGDLMVLAAFALILRGIIQGVRQLGMAFSGETEDEVVFLDRVRQDEAQGIRGIRRNLEFGGNPNQKIRRLYRKLIRRKTKRKPGIFETPAEIEKNSGLTPLEGSRDLHELYEMARYSREGCDEEQAGEMRRIVSNLR